MTPNWVAETWATYWRTRLAPSIVARSRLRWVVSHDREAVPAWRWVATTYPSGIFHIDTGRRLLPDGRSVPMPKVWRKARYRLERRR